MRDIVGISTGSLRSLDQADEEVIATLDHFVLQI